jgi:hypothetical protein
MAIRPDQRRLFRELAAKFGPEVARAFIQAINELKAGVELQRLENAVRRGDLQDAIDALHIDRAAFLPLENKIIEAYEAGGQGAAASMPRSVSVGYRFDPGNQRAASWIQRHAATLITGLFENEVAQARTHLAAGMARGASPRAVALDLVGRISRVTGSREGGLIGLSGPQREAVEAARAEIASGDPAGLRNYLTRKRRDRRFDKTVQTAIKQGGSIPADTARNMITRYTARLVQLRGEVIARTEGLPAIRAAKREAYQQLVDDGRIDGRSIVRGWHTIRDGRERDTHGDMNGQRVRGLDQPFTSPSGARMRYPGDTSLGAPASETISCRCDESIYIRPVE